jgi:hypothetical protein
MPGKICIITPTGIVCEATSYESHYPFGPRGKLGKQCTYDDGPKPRGLKLRIEKLMQKAGIADDDDVTPFMIVPKLAAPRKRR